MENKSDQMVAIALQLSMQMVHSLLMLALETEKILEMLLVLPQRHHHGDYLVVMEELR